MACLSADEVHKPSGDPQDKPEPLKINLNTKANIKNTSENHHKF